MLEFADQLGISAMNAFSIDPHTTSLVVVDMQYASCDPDHGHSRLYRDLGLADEIRYYHDRLDSLVIPNIQRLLAAFRDVGSRIIFLTVGPESKDLAAVGVRGRLRFEFLRKRGLEAPSAAVDDPSHAILQELSPRPGEAVINKTTASAFNSSRFATHLNEHGVTTLVVCGVGTNYCVEMTFRDASDRGYLCVLAEDACAAYTASMHERATYMMKYYGRVETTETIMKEVLQNAVFAGAAETEASSGEQRSAKGQP